MNTIPLQISTDGNEQYDVILANPPFMTPKGGIIPHNRYRVQAKRSEVLFVDYIAEHLSTNGLVAMIFRKLVCDFINGRAFKPEDWTEREKGGLPIIRIQNLNEKNAKFNYYDGIYDEKHIVNNSDLLFSWSGSRGTSFGAHIWTGEKALLNQHIFRVEHKKTLIKKYLSIALNQAVSVVEENLHGGVGLVHITKGNLEKIKIPLPPLSIQEQIVAEIESYQKIIDGARQVVENYKPTIKIDPSWDIVELGKVCEINPKPQFRDNDGLVSFVLWKI